MIRMHVRANRNLFIVLYRLSRSVECGALGGVRVVGMHGLRGATGYRRWRRSILRSSGYPERV